MQLLVSFVRMGNDVERLFGARVRELRQARGWTQEELARRLTDAGYSVHQTTIAKLEGATRPTDVAEAAAIAAIFGVSIGTLFRTAPTRIAAQLELMRRANVLDEIQKERRALQERLSALDEQYDAAEVAYQEFRQRLTNHWGIEDKEDR